MVTQLDVTTGELYSLVLAEEDMPIVAEFAKEMRDGRLMFRREGTDREIYIPVDEFERMRTTSGQARRIRLDKHGQLIEQAEIDPVFLLDPDESGITVAERDLRLRQKDELVRKQTLRFYVMRYDNEPVPTRGRSGVARIIKRHLPDALEAGFTWKPSPSSLLRAVDECGTPGERPLTAFFPDRKKELRQRRWPKEIVDASVRAIETYWDDDTVSIGDAIYQFRVEAQLIAERHHLPMITEEPEVLEFEGDETERDLFALRLLEPKQLAGPVRARKVGYPVPCDETIRLWLHQNADWWHWAQRYGVDNANRRFKGRGRTFEATRPLEYVMFDHTKIDAWAIVEDDEGQPLFVARAWLTLAIDCYSRMIVGAVIGYEPPSIHSVIACLKQVVRPKGFLDEYAGWKGADDGWGRPFTIIVDNGKEFVSPSFQASCEAAGIDVMWAPVGRPTYKAYVERIFGTLNTVLWHKLPGGLPLTPQQRRELDIGAEAEAAFTRSQLERAMWNAIVTLYHVETHSTIGMAPALKWRRGMELRHRATVDDIAMLDKVIGRSKNGLLTAEGVTVDGHRFHDPQITSMLMNRLGPLAKLSRQRRGVTSSRTIRVRVTWDPGDVTQAHVFDPTTGLSVTLPNWHRQFSHDLSWYAAAKIKEWATERSMKFHSDDDKARARVAHREYLLDILPGMKSVERHRRARVIEPLKELMPGDRVEMVKVDRSSQYDLPHDTAAKRADHPMEVKRGRPFGGKAGQAKGAKTRAQNRAKKAEAVQVNQSVPAVPSLPRTPGNPAPKVDIAAIRAKVAARMNASENSGDAK
ncbi:DDE-type integrase/transposase/recombinase [Devosia sp. A369]